MLVYTGVYTSTGFEACRVIATRQPCDILCHRPAGTVVLKMNSNNFPMLPRNVFAILGSTNKIKFIHFYTCFEKWAFTLYLTNP